MIIECARCRTRYRFDEDGIEGDGFWVRCSRCRHVFFQGLTDRGIQIGWPPEGIGIDETVPDPTAGGPLREAIHSRSEEIRSAGEERKMADLSPEEWEDVDVEKVTEEPEGEVPPEGQEGNDGRPWVRLSLYLLTALLLAAGVYLWMFPQVREQALQGLSTLPVIQQLFAKKQLSGETGPAQVALKDVRQRFVTNWLMGNVRVVEGTAVNQAKYPLTRISIRGELYDASAVILAERVVSCGNVLSDQELSSMSEDEVQRELSLPQGSDVSNDRIEPGGQIPFMIVFAHEPPGVAKAVVVPVGAERLLQ